MENGLRQARIHAFAGDLAKAGELLKDARRTLDAHGKERSPRAEIRWDLESGRWFLLSKIPSKAAPFFLSAFDKAQTEKLISFAIEASVMMAVGQPLKNRAAWLKRAVEAAESSATESGRRWLPCLHLMTGWSLLDSRNFQEALTHFDRALTQTSVSTGGERARPLRWARGQALRELKRFDEALEAQRALRAEFAAAGLVNGYVELEIAESLQAMGNPDEARGHFETAHRSLSQDPFYTDNSPTELKRILKLSKDN